MIPKLVSKILVVVMPASGPDGGQARWCEIKRWNEVIDSAGVEKVN
jgi:hypothetical protein